MSLPKRLDIRNKCLTVRDQTGCLVIKGGTRQYGESFIMCVQGDERILRDSFDEYLATDVFNHYVRCRDINYLRDTTTKEFVDTDIIGLEFNFIHTDPEESATLKIKSGTHVAEISTSVTTDTTSDEPVFQFGSGQEQIQFTKPEQKHVKIGDYWYFVTFVSFHTAVFTIDRVTDTLLPEGTIVATEELIGEMVVNDTDVQNVPTTYSKFDELIGEFVLTTETPPESLKYKLMLEEMVGEIVISDGSQDFFGPTDATVCDIPFVFPSPTPTPTVTPSITISPSVTPSITISPTITPTVTPSMSITPTVTPTMSVTPTVTPTMSVTPTVTPSITVSNSVTPSITITPTMSVTPTTTPPFWYDQYEECPGIPEPDRDWNPYWANVYEPCDPPHDPPFRTIDEVKGDSIWKNVYEPFGEPGCGKEPVGECK